MPIYRNSVDNFGEKIREDHYERTWSWLCIGNNEGLENDRGIRFKSRSLLLGRSFRDDEDYLIRASRRYTPVSSQNISTEIDYEDD